jgi:hypothetical protein
VWEHLVARDGSCSANIDAEPSTPARAIISGVETVRHVLRAAKVLAREPTIPRWIRWLFVFGLMPIPLFFDEVALILATGLMLVFHRRSVVAAWAETRTNDHLRDRVTLGMPVMPVVTRSGLLGRPGHGQPAIDDQRLAGDVTGCMREEEVDDIGHLVGLPDPTERNPCR